MKHLKEFGKLNEAATKDEKLMYRARFNVEKGSGHSALDWKKYIEAAKIEGCTVKTGESGLKHHRDVVVDVPTKAGAAKVIKALKKFGIGWPEVGDFQMPNNKGEGR